MTSLLPPNLLKLFAPRPPVPYLKPLTKDESVRGPNRIGGISTLVHSIREQAVDDEVKQGMQPGVQETALEGRTPVPAASAEPTVKEAKPEKDTEGDVEMNGAEAGNGEDGEVPEGGPSKPKTTVEKKKRKDKIAELGIIGQEAVKMRRELRAKRKEEYKKSLEKNCALLLSCSESMVADCQTDHRTTRKL